MKIEKINDNQIRCTLTRADLAARHLKLSELAYGTEKAKMLFHDMMQQAFSEFGFEADDIPLMIEAIPSSPDSIVLIITKVDNPEELDTRFSKFAPLDDADTKQTMLEKLEGAEEFVDLLNKVKSAVAEPLTDEKEISEKSPALPAIRLFSFSNFDSVIYAAKLLHTMYQGANTLYKNEASGIFVLALTQSNHTGNEFSKICNMLSEYGSIEKASGAALAYLEEHYKTIIPADAVRRLAEI
ncbi:MAG: adaptor protein MecA [Lachnospiraceae bacterium]|nr:adaptor protein MecA [Lachnospiraceae bacterium]